MTGHLRLISWCLFLAALFAVGCSSGSKTRFRVMNGVVDESDLSIVEDGNNVSNNLAYATSTGYLSAHAGSHQIQIEPSGTSNVFLTQTVNFSSGTDTTILPFNFSSSPESLVLVDDNSAPTVSPTITDLAFGASSSYQNLTAGSYEIIYAFAGQKSIAIDSGSLSFSSGQIRSFVGLNGQSGGFTDALLPDVN